VYQLIVGRRLGVSLDQMGTSAYQVSGGTSFLGVNLVEGKVAAANDAAGCSGSDVFACDSNYFVFLITGGTS